MSNREFCQLSKVHKDEDVMGWLESSKLDGFRCIWDGGVSRGIPKANVPWANHAKDGRYLVEPVATGLWSRYGNVIHAPDWWLDLLPVGVVLDGECFNPSMSRQQVRSICAKLNPTADWRLIEYHVFNRLSPAVWLQEGRINNPNFVEKIIDSSHYDWYLGQGGKVFYSHPYGLVYGHLQRQAYWCDNVVLVQQSKIKHVRQISARLIEEMDKEHGEGLILTDPFAFTGMKRVSSSLKVKPRDSSEGKIVGYISGKGKLQGMLGALILEWEGKRLEMSGFTNEERTLSSPFGEEGVELPNDITCPHFPIGHMIGFNYRNLTDDGLPQEAAYCRVEGTYKEKLG